MSIKFIKFCLFSCAVVMIGCSSSRSAGLSNKVLDVIANPHATTNQLIYALKLLAASRATNEPPKFWTAIANSSDYSVDHRRRAVLQLLARHFHPGMTFGEVGRLFDHPTWINPLNLGGGPAGNLPDGANETDGLAFVSISCGQSRAPVVWFRFRNGYMGSGNDLYQCLEGKPNNLELAHIRIDGIISSENIPGHGLIYNSFGIPP